MLIATITLALLAVQAATPVRAAEELAESSKPSSGEPLSLDRLDLVNLSKMNAQTRDLGPEAKCNQFEDSLRKMLSGHPASAGSRRELLTVVTDLLAARKLPFDNDQPVLSALLACKELFPVDSRLSGSPSADSEVKREVIASPPERAPLTSQGDSILDAHREFNSVRDRVRDHGQDLYSPAERARTYARQDSIDSSGDASSSVGSVNSEDMKTGYRHLYRNSDAEDDARRAEDLRRRESFDYRAGADSFDSDRARRGSSDYDSSRFGRRVGGGSYDGYAGGLHDGRSRAELKAELEELYAELRKPAHERRWGKLDMERVRQIERLVDEYDEAESAYRPRTENDYEVGRILRERIGAESDPARRLELVLNKAHLARYLRELVSRAGGATGAGYGNAYGHGHGLGGLAGGLVGGYAGADYGTSSGLLARLDRLAEEAQLKDGMREHLRRVYGELGASDEEAEAILLLKQEIFAESLDAEHSSLRDERIEREYNRAIRDERMPVRKLELLLAKKRAYRELREHLERLDRDIREKRITPTQEQLDELISYEYNSLGNTVYTEAAERELDRQISLESDPVIRLGLLVEKEQLTRLRARQMGGGVSGLNNVAHVVGGTNLHSAVDAHQDQYRQEERYRELELRYREAIETGEHLAHELNEARERLRRLADTTALHPTGYNRDLKELRTPAAIVHALQEHFGARDDLPDRCYKYYLALNFPDKVDRKVAKTIARLPAGSSEVVLGSGGYARELNRLAATLSSAPTAEGAGHHTTASERAARELYECSQLAAARKAVAAAHMRPHLSHPEVAHPLPGHAVPFAAPIPGYPSAHHPVAAGPHAAPLHPVGHYGATTGGLGAGAPAAGLAHGPATINGMSRVDRWQYQGAHPAGRRATDLFPFPPMPKLAAQFRTRAH